MKNRNSTLKRIFAGILSVAIVSSLTACSGSASNTGSASAAAGSTQSTGTAAATSKAAGKVPLSISGQPYIHALPNIYAQNNGLFDAFNVNLTMYSSGPTQNEALASKGWEVGTTGTGGAILGAAGYNLKIIGFTCGDTNTTDLWVKPDSPLAKAAKDPQGIYGTAQDWKGKKILCATGTSCQMVLIGTLKHLGLSMNQVNVVDMSVAQSFPAFKAGQADIVALWSPFGFAAEKEGWVKIASAKDLGIELPCLIVASDDAIKNRPEVVQQWLEAYLKSTEALNKDQTASAKLLFNFEKQQGIKMDEDASVKEVQNRPFTSIADNKELFKKDADGNSKAQEIMLQFADFMIAQGKLKPEDKKKIIDNGFIDSSFIEKVAS